jgi:hypothetical protein
LKIIREYCSDIKLIKAIEKKYLLENDNDYKKMECIYPQLEKKDEPFIIPLNFIQKKFKK